MSECSPKHPRRKHKERKTSAKVRLQEVQIIRDFVVQFCYSKKAKYLRQVENALEGAAAISVYTGGCTVWGFSYEKLFLLLFTW